MLKDSQHEEMHPDSMEPVEGIQGDINQNVDDEEFFSAMAEISLEQALSSDESEKWQEAILSEIKSLVKNETWDIVKKPKDREIVSCR